MKAVGVMIGSAVTLAGVAIIATSLFGNDESEDGDAELSGDDEDDVMPCGLSERQKEVLASL